MSPDAPAGGGGPGHFRQSASTINCHGHASVPVHGSPAARRMTPQDHQRANTLRRAKCVYDALCKAQSRVGPAIKEETGCALDEALSGILPAVVIMVGVLAASAALGGAVGAMIGALAGGVGAIPGAAAGAATGAELGMLLLNGLGIGFLAVYIVQHITKVFDLATQGVKEAWDAPASPMPTSAKIDHASRSLARSVAVLIRLILEGIVLYLLEKGTAVTAQRVSEVGAKLRASKLGVRLAEYVERNWKALVENPKLKRNSSGPKSGGSSSNRESPSIYSEAQKATYKSASGKDVGSKIEKITPTDIDGEKAALQRIGLKNRDSAIFHERINLKQYVNDKDIEGLVGKLDVSSPKDGAVFWSGTKYEAQQYAKEIGGVTLETTKGGKIVDEWPYMQKKMPWKDEGRKFWMSLSENYASQASGKINVVRNKIGEIWAEVEKPILDLNPYVIKPYNIIELP